MISGKIQTIALIVLLCILSIILFMFGMKSYAVRSSSDALQENVQAMVYKYKDESFRRNVGSFYLDKASFEPAVKTRVASQANLVLVANQAAYDDIASTMKNGTTAQKKALTDKYDGKRLAYMTFDYLASANGDSKSISGVKVTLYANEGTIISSGMQPKTYISRYVISPRSDTRDSKDIAQYQSSIVQ